MMNTSDDLAQTLHHLHKLLLETKSVDEETKSKLVRLADEIEQLNQGNVVDALSINQRLQKALIVSEEEHPTLTKVLTRMALLLGDMGI